jgi:hypothetical protein
MQRDLSKLTHELRKETCPRRVRDEVQRQISAQGSVRGWSRYAVPAAAAGLGLACCLWIWRWSADGHAGREAASAERVSRERIQIANQAAEALEFVGSILAKAGARSEKVISDQAVAPLRNSLQAAKNKIIHIEL